MTSPSPALIVTPGEPAGIGPDIILMAHAIAVREALPAFAVTGCARFLEERARQCGIAGVKVVRIGSMDEVAAAFVHGLPVLDMPVAADVTPGKPAPYTAAQVTGWIDEAVRLVLAGNATGMVTGPIQKETLYQAGFSFQGHTDYLAHLARQAGHEAEPVMMLSAGDFRTVPLTVHVPLSQVPELVTGTAIIAQGRVIARDLKRHFGIGRPRIAVAGLNPHAGEGGSIGLEDRDIIGPAVAALASEGIDAFGPLSADTMFHEEARATYDVALCMYHDQALIPIKTLGFHIGVNTTLGLPFIRTSPDHGTALALAGTGQANPSSFIAALKQAETMARAQA
jgi:4-hydroxythreonine-4-phosphate dehydrogenase